MSQSPITLIVELDITLLLGCSSVKGLPSLSINKLLSEFIINETGPERTYAIKGWLENRLREETGDTVVCKDVDFLFHPSLNLDPLVLFGQLGRSAKLIVLWPGEYKGGILTYAQPEHKHYRFWKNPTGINIKGANDAL